MDPSAQIAALVDQVRAHVPIEVADGGRFVVALAGPPAAGKSTLATALADALAPRAAILGLDAFHFDDSVLTTRGHRERKGAPHTFDVASYAHLLRGLRTTRTELAVPVFDRSLELSRNCAEVVTSAHDVVITEGNYLLVDWTAGSLTASHTKRREPRRRRTTSRTPTGSSTTPDRPNYGSPRHRDDLWMKKSSGLAR